MRYETDLRPTLQHRVSTAARKTAQVETLHISDELNIDLAPDGTVYGIELLNANAQLQATDQGKLVIINEALGQRQEVSFK